MANMDKVGKRGFDRSYKRGTIMGLTVAEAFILLSFCLLLLFTWWQRDTEKRNLMTAEALGELNDFEKSQIMSALTDGTVTAALELRDAGFPMSDAPAIELATRLEKAMRDPELKKMVESLERLSKAERVALSGVVDLSDKNSINEIINSLKDGSLQAAIKLRDAGFKPDDLEAISDTTAYSRFMREEDLQRLMKGIVKLPSDLRLSLANAVEVTPEAAMRAALLEMTKSDGALTQIAEKIENAARAQAGLQALLDQSLGAKIREAGGSIDKYGTITLPEAVLFESGKDKIKNEGFLSEICGTWIATLRNSQMDIKSLQIEGHASSEWEQETPELAYLKNLDLSQRRAQSALVLCLGGMDDTENQIWAREHLAAIGYSSAHFIPNIDGSENKGASRRVEFSVTVDQEKLIEDIKGDVTGE